MLEPRITIYGQILDNKTQTEIRGYHEWHADRVWYFGQINGIAGGESPYIVEFDIWNNEPAINSLSGLEIVSDVKNCNFSVWDKSNLLTTNNVKHSSTMLVQTRCITNNYESNYKSIAGPVRLTDIYGNVDSTNKGVLFGGMGGDHTKLQTKIVLPNMKAISEPPISVGDRKFVFAFYYEYE